MSRRRLLFLALASAVVLTPLVGQSQSSRTPAARQAPAARITFAETIAPIVYANCVTCHRPGEAAPFSLISYEDVDSRTHRLRRSPRGSNRACLVARKAGCQSFRSFRRTAGDLANRI